MKHKILSFLLCLMVISTSAISAMATNIPKSDVGTDTEEVIISEVDWVDSFIESLDPALYGGVYYDNDHNLCVQAVNKPAMETYLSKSREASEYLGEIKVVQAKYTMNELEAAKKIVLNLKDLGINLVGFDEEKNAVLVYVNTKTAEVEQAILKASPVKNVVVLEGGNEAKDISISDENKVSDNGSAVPAATQTTDTEEKTAMNKLSSQTALKAVCFFMPQLV